MLGAATVKFLLENFSDSVKVRRYEEWRECVAGGYHRTWGCRAHTPL